MRQITPQASGQAPGYRPSPRGTGLRAKRKPPDFSGGLSNLVPRTGIQECIFATSKFLVLCAQKHWEKVIITDAYARCERSAPCCCVCSILRDFGVFFKKLTPFSHLFPIGGPFDRTTFHIAVSRFEYTSAVRSDQR